MGCHSWLSYTARFKKSKKNLSHTCRFSWNFGAILQIFFSVAHQGDALGMDLVRLCCIARWMAILGRDLPYVTLKRCLKMMVYSTFCDVYTKKHPSQTQKNCRSTKNSTGQPQKMPPKLPEAFRFKNHSTLPKCVLFFCVIRLQTTWDFQP